MALIGVNLSLVGLVVVLLSLACSGSPATGGPKRTLVLLDNWTIKETHSIFFKTLRGE